MMNSIFEKSLFSEIEEFFSSRGFTVFNDDIDGKNILVMEPDSDVSFEDCNISVNETDEDITSVNILFTLETELLDDLSDSVDMLLPYLNKYLNIGSFGLVKESGYFYFSYSYIADTKAETEQAMKVFLMTWQIASDTAAEGMDTVRALISRDAELSELLNEDSSIIQFE